MLSNQKLAHLKQLDDVLDYFKSIKNERKPKEEFWKKLHKGFSWTNMVIKFTNGDEKEFAKIVDYLAKLELITKLEYHVYEISKEGELFEGFINKEIKMNKKEPHWFFKIVIDKVTGVIIGIILTLLFTWLTGLLQLPQSKQESSKSLSKQPIVLTAKSDSLWAHYLMDLRKHK